jgi:uncharacterized membrane protein HdeD (DUF308 family)
MKVKKIRNSLTVNSISWLILGVSGILAGIFLLISWRTFYLYLATGLIAIGFGGTICGLTNGFTDQSANGRVLSKFGLLALIVGALLIIYYAYRFI